jgi:predicted Zn-ribbon and HTH transcriptional regulator
MTMPETFNGHPRKKYRCIDHYMKVNGKEVFVKGCGFTFVTCGNPQTCPKCHVQLPIDESAKGKRKT